MSAVLLKGAATPGWHPPAQQVYIHPGMAGVGSAEMREAGDMLRCPSDLRRVIRGPLPFPPESAWPGQLWFKHYSCVAQASPGSFLMSSGVGGGGLVEADRSGKLVPK